jgi:uncharacterized protein (DUF433 family)
VERLAAQQGHKPAQVGARLVEEGIRRRHYPQIELRETSGGRVAYIKGTRLAVYWIIERAREGMSVERVSRELGIPSTQVTAALAYGKAFSEEIEAEIEEARANQDWLEAQESAWRAGHSPEQKRSRAVKPRR